MRTARKRLRMKYLANILLNLTLDRFLPSLPLRSSPSNAG